MLVPDAPSQALTATLADEPGKSFTAVEYDRFPDGGTLAAVPGFDTNATTIITSTASNDAYVGLLQLQDTVCGADASAVTTVIPCMGYARQDKAFKTGHPISARAVIHAVSTTTDCIMPANPHEDAVADFFDVLVDIVDTAGRLVEPLPEPDVPLFLSSDSGATDIAGTVRDAYGEGETDYFERMRHSGTDVDITPSDVDLEGHDVVITDGIIITGLTMSEAVGVLVGSDTKRVFCATIHSLLARNVRTRLTRVGIERIVGTGTIGHDVDEVSVAPALAGEIER